MTEAQDRRGRGLAVWEQVTQKPAPEPGDSPIGSAMIDFVGAEVWGRPGLSFRDRRWISLTCAAIAAQTTPIKAHVRSALLSGDITADELNEFVLHFAVYAGWPMATGLTGAIKEVTAELGRLE